MAIVYMLCGLPGSGKTTYAAKLEKEGVMRLTLDEELFKLFGRELPEGTYPEFEQKTKAALTDRLVNYLKGGKSVVLDWGFWKKEERDRITNLIRAQGGEPKLLYFKGILSELSNRVRGRDLTKNHVISHEMMEEFGKSFEEPQAEGEIIM